MSCYLAPVTNQQGKPSMRMIHHLFIDPTFLNKFHKHTGPGVNLLWRGMQYPNNSNWNVEDVGEGDRALACQTDRRPCCGMLPYRFGEWYYPNGNIVPTEGEKAAFYRSRSDEGLVLLHRRNYPGTASFTGLFCCVLPDATDINQTLCVELLPIGTDINGTLICCSYSNSKVCMRGWRDCQFSSLLLISSAGTIRSLCMV